MVFCNSTPLIRQFTIQLFHVKQHDISYQSVPRETFSAVDKIIQTNQEPFDHYLDRLLWWNKRINLVSRDVPRETIREHIRHSLLISGLDCYKNSSLIVDSGTGGGLPGFPLSIISPEKSFILNDIVTKKVMAVKQMAKTLGLQNVSSVDFSIEEATIGSPFLLISKHAFKIDNLYRMTAGMPWKHMVFYKGMDFEKELENIDTPLSVVAYDLFKESKEPFYRDKAIITISKK